MHAKRFVAILLVFVLLTLNPLTIIYATTLQREISYTGLVPSGYVWIAYTTYSGWTKPQNITEQTDSKYCFNVEGDDKRYILLDSFDKNDTREHFAMLETSTLKAYWDSASPSTAVNYEYNLDSTTQLPGIINSKDGIDIYISKKIQDYVKPHSYQIEGVKNGTYTGEFVECKYSLLALSEYVAYADKIGYYSGNTNAFLRTPYNSSGKAQGGAVLQKGTTTDGTVTARVIKGYNAAVRPVFYFDGSFFERERVDLSTAGLSVINEILKTENKNNIYTQEEWLSIETVDITGAEETISIKSNGSKIKSGFTLTAANLPVGYQKGKFIVSEDENKWTFVNNNSSSTLSCLITNDMAGKYIRFYAEKDGKKYVSPSVLVGENLKRFLTKASNELDEAEYEVCGEFHFELGNNYNQYGYSVLASEDDKVLLLSKYLGKSLAYYAKDPSVELVQKYDPNDTLSIAYEINKESFINQYILPQNYHQYILESEWETEAGTIAPMNNDTVTFSKIAIPANWEIENYRGGLGYGVSRGVMLRTPAESVSGTSTAQVVTENGKLINYSQEKKGYYSARVQFWLDKDIFKTVKLDINRADERMLKMLDLPQIMSKEEAENLGYTNIELARLGYDKLGAVSYIYTNKNFVRGYIEYVNYDEDKEVNVASLVYSSINGQNYLKDVKISKVAFEKTDSYNAENKQRILYKETLDSNLNDGEFVKLIVWDSLYNIKPLANAVQKDDDEWNSVFYTEDFFNLVTSFVGDAKTKRGFSWQAIPNCADMVIQYGINSQNLSEEKEASFEIADIAYNNQAYKSEATAAAPPKLEDFMLFYKVELENLSLGTKYYYRIGDKVRNVWSETYSFETEKENETGFYAIGLTDTQSSEDELYEQYYKPSWQAALRDCVDAKFVIHNGDLTSNSLWEEWTYYLFKNSKGMCETLPIMATMGNHDAGMSRASLGARNFVLRFNYPKNGYGLADNYDFTKDNKSRYATAIIKELDGTVYSYDYGNAHFSVINTGPEWGSTEDVLKLQTKWLDEDLKNTNNKWKIVVCHIPIYTVDGVLEPNMEKYANMASTLSDIIEANKVDMVLNGHTHAYMRTHQLKGGEVISTSDTVNKGEGTIYTILGLSGPAEGETVSQSDIPELIAKRHSMGRNNNILPSYNIFHFTDKELTYTTKLSDGTLIDTITIKE